MASAGDRFEMPDGSVYALLVPAAETAGEYVEMEFILPSGCVPPPPHVHPSQVESYEVIEGELEVIVEGEWRTLAAGESVSVPAGVLHTFRNRSGSVARVRNRHAPAIGFEDYIGQISAALAAAGIRGGRDPRIPLILSAVTLSYPQTLQPGRLRERIPMRVMAALARLVRLPVG